MHRPIITAVVALLTAFAGSPAHAEPVKKSIRVVYLIPKDRTERADYRTAIESTMREVQLWYACNLNGKTFQLNEPMIEVRKTAHNSAWYAENRPANSTDKNLFTWYNTSDDARLLIGAKPGDPDYTWVVYIDAPGGTGAGVEGLAILVEHDLKGLLKQHNIGGSAHEIGHALGRPHPGAAHAQALMETGYINYPRCYLTPEDITALNKSKFIHSGVNVKSRQRHCFIYDGGHFRGTKDGKFFESKSGRNNFLTFVLRRQNKEFYYLEDPSRRIWVALPKAGTGNQSFWAADDKDYTKAYKIQD